MKVQRSFRLSDSANMRIQKLSEEYNCSHTDIIERAVRMLYALENTSDDLDITVKQLKLVWLI